jgi:hypothetical protein
MSSRHAFDVDDNKDSQTLYSSINSSWGSAKNPGIICVTLETDNGKWLLHITPDGRSIEEELYPDYAGEGLKELKPTPAKIVERLRDAGLLTHLCYSCSKSHIFCFVALPIKRMREWTNTRAIDLKLNPRMAVLYGRRNEVNCTLAKNTFLPGEDEWETRVELEDWSSCDEKKIRRLSLDLWKGLYVQFDSGVPETIYRMYADGSIFSSSEQLQMLDEIIKADPELGGAGLKIMELSKTSHPVCGVFAVDDHKRLHNLIPNQMYCKLFCKVQMYWKLCGKVWHEVALCNLRHYYGEKIAFYFAFLQYYTMSLIYPSVVGAVFFILQLVQDEVVCDGIWSWIMFLIFWDAVFCKTWRAYEKNLRKRWGMVRYSEKAVPRPEFKGKYNFCEVSGRLLEFEEKGKKRRKQFISYTTVFFWACLVGVAIYVLLVATHLSVDSTQRRLIALANAVQIQVYNLIYAYIANRLNNWENHRLRVSFENSMIVKKIVFQVVNSFASLFFIAFFKPFFYSDSYDSEDSSGINSEVLQELRIQLAILFMTLIFLQNTQEILLTPVLLMVCKRIKAMRGPSRRMTLRWQPRDSCNDHLGEAYHPYNIEDLRADAQLQIESPKPCNVIDNMSELIIEQGYATMFAIAFPLAPFLAFVNNFVEFFVDYRNLESNQRPIPYAAHGVGLWGDVLVVFAGISIATNWALFVYRTDLVEDEVEHYVFVIGIGITCSLILIINNYSVGQDMHLERAEEIEKWLIVKGQKNSSEQLEFKPDERPRDVTTEEITSSEFRTNLGNGAVITF